MRIVIRQHFRKSKQIIFVRMLVEVPVGKIIGVFYIQ